jgi:amidase
MPPPGGRDVLQLTALEQAAEIRRGALGSEELVTRYLERIAERDDHLTAFVTVLRSSALRTAREWDRRRRRGDPLPVYAGVPTGIKDIDPVRGAFVRAGSRSMRWLVAPFDAGSVRRIRKGGMVLLGKTTTSELAILPITEPDIHRPTRNPWDRERTAGGSSGGAACAVAGGLLPIAHASDGAGSIRIPAAFCHLYGFKPSRDGMPNFYAASDRVGLAATGCVAQTVHDAAAMLDVLRGLPGPDAGESSWLRRCEQPPGALRVRLVLDSPLVTVDRTIRDATERAARTLVDLGHHVEVGPPLAVGTVDEFLPVMQRMISNVPVISRRLLQPLTAWMHREGRRLTQRQAAALLHTLSARVLEWFGDWDLLLTPTVGVLPPQVGAFNGLAPPAMFEAVASLGAFTAPFNLSGQPAASIPWGVVEGRWPFGLQVVGPPGGDLRVLQVSRQIEAAVPWRHRQPA